jgi:tetratricopeptide (TPR) repeat protein
MADKRSVEKEVLGLENKVLPLINFLDIEDSCRKALLFLDKATQLDNNCYTCFSNKLIFQNALKNYTEAISTINQCIRLNPQSYDLYLKGGVFYAKNGDSVNAKSYFQKALELCSAKISLDKTMDKPFQQQGDYDWYVSRIDQAIILKLLGENEKADTILTNIYSIPPTYSQDTEAIRKSIVSILASDRKQLLDSTFR